MNIVDPKILGLLQPPAKWPPEKILEMAKELTGLGLPQEDLTGFREMLWWASVGSQADELMALSDTANATLRKVATEYSEELERLKLELELTQVEKGARGKVIDRLKAENEKLAGIVKGLMAPYQDDDPADFSEGGECPYCGQESGKKLDDEEDIEHSSDCAWLHAKQALAITDAKGEGEKIELTD